MASLTLQGSTSGQITLATPAVAGTNTITLPAATGTVLTTAGGQTISGTVTLSTLTSPAATNLTIQSAGTTAMTIDTSQNVGIGTTSPSYKLHVYQNSASDTVILSQNAYLGYGATIQTNANSEYSFYQSIGTTRNWIVGQRGVAAGYFTIYDATASASRVAIDTSGNVGIGTSSPNSRLVVNGGTSTSQIRWEVNNAAFTQEVSTNAAVNAYVYKSNDASYHIWKVSSTEQMRLDASGNLLVGTTDLSLSSGVGVKFFNTTPTPYMGYVMNTAGAANNYHLYNTNATNNGYRFYVGIDGGIRNYSSNNVNLSDERVKTDIQSAGNYLDKICAIPVRTFKYKDQGDDPEKTLGVIAQEVEMVAPELVNNDGFGETPEDGVPLKTIYQTDFQYALMKCIQELKAELDALKGTK